jgi:DNA-binding transcriptional MerR regulator
MSIAKKITVVLMLLAIALPVWAQRAGGRARTLVDRLIKERRTGRHISPERLQYNERRYQSQVLRLMRRRSGLTTRELDINHLREYVGKYERHPQNLESLTQVLQSVTARGNVIPAQQQATANVLAQALKLGKRGKFMIEPRDIKEIDRHWTVQEKDMLADVLLEARRIAKEENISPDAAFNKALENRGLLSKFKRRCR